MLYFKPLPLEKKVLTPIDMVTLTSNVCASLTWF